jgi:hypothetical protein
LAQPVIPLADIQAENHISYIPVYAPTAASQPKARKSYASLALFLIFPIVALGAVAAFYYFPAQNKTDASDVSQSAIDDSIDDSVKSKTSISQKPVNAQSNRKIITSTAQADENKSDDQPPRTAQNMPTLTPDETVPGEWKHDEETADVEIENQPESPAKPRRENKTDDKFEKFVREVEKAERQTRRLKKVIDDISQD